MPYVTKEHIIDVRETLKKEFPKIKFSVRRNGSSTISVSIMSAPIDMLIQEDGVGKSYQQVNHFYIGDHYNEYPKIRDVLQKVYSIMNNGNRTICEDADYGNVPSFYCDLSIGQWDKPFIKK